MKEANIMDKQREALSNDLEILAKDAHALLAASAEATGEKVGEARERLAAALENGREIYGRVREQAVSGAKATDKTVRTRPYQAIGIAMGVGALLGYFAAGLCSRKD
jgi:ElaB/YqjD/DUF883 family membrane-anchored ribosome-binding protein